MKKKIYLLTNVPARCIEFFVKKIFLFSHRHRRFIILNYKVIVISNTYFYFIDLFSFWNLKLPWSIIIILQVTLSYVISMKMSVKLL